MAPCLTMPAYFMVIIFLIRVMARLRKLKQWSCFKLPRKLLNFGFSENLFFDIESVQLASEDYGHMIHKAPLGVLRPSSVHDIKGLISFAYNSKVPFTIAARGRGHSVHGQSMAHNGIVVDMISLRRSNAADDSGVKIGWSESLGYYADVGGAQLWIDVLNETLKSGLAPVSWTDYLYLSVGGTLSNAGISGQSFRYGPQISNVYEMDVVTGRGELLSCSPQLNSELFFGVLGGLGQFGIITRARVRLGRSPKMVKWIRMLYTDFAAFSADQEHLITRNSAAIDYLEGSIFMGNGPPNNWRSSFYSSNDAKRIVSLLCQHGIVYCLEIAKYNDGQSADMELQKSLKGLGFLEGFIFEKEVGLVEFLDRVRAGELKLQSQGLWEVPHPWLNLFVPKSRVFDFHDGVIKDIVQRRNITTTGVVLFYPMRRDKWDDCTSAVIPDEETFYSVGFLHSATSENWRIYDQQNREILMFCEKAGIGVKQYMANHATQEQWVNHFAGKWPSFLRRKLLFDPKSLLSPGQRIFNR